MDFDNLYTSPASEEPTEATEAVTEVLDVTEPLEEPTEATEAVTEVLEETESITVEVIDYTSYLEEINKNISDIMALNLVLVLITIFTFMSRFFKLNRRDY